MRVYREYGESRSALRFSGEALKVLAYAPDPQAALEEDNSRKEAGEDVTARIALFSPTRISLLTFALTFVP